MQLQSICDNRVIRSTPSGLWIAPIVLGLGLTLSACNSSSGSDPTAEKPPVDEPSDPPQEYSAIIVGSGFGGSVSALRLGEAGVQTLVLERGRWWTVKDPTKDAGTFATLETVLAPGGDGRSSWLSDVCVGNVYLTLLPPITCPVTTGIVDFSDAEPNAYDKGVKLKVQGVATVTAAGVGGGSLVYNGVTYMPSKAGWDAAFPTDKFPYMQDIWTELNDDGYFAKALQNLDPEVIPDDILNTDPGRPDYYESSRNQRDNSIASGYSMDPNDPNYEIHGTGEVTVTYDWNLVREEIEGKRTKSVVLGEVWWGTNSDAKKTLDKPAGYLGRAIATGHVEVKALHEVTRIQYDPAEDTYLVTALSYDENYQAQKTVQFKTHNLIMSAGSVGTSKLLTRAKGNGDLPDLNEYVGTLWTTNGNIFAFRHLRSPNDIVLQGGPAGFKTVVYDNPASPIVIENLAHRAPAIFAADPLTANLLKMNFTIGLGIPQGSGTFSYEPKDDSVTLNWPDDADTNVLAAFQSAFESLAAEADRMVLPTAQDGTVHPLGGMPLGLATDTHCRVKNYPGLYAIDGSVLPGPGALTNPSMLITAMSERCIADLKDEIRCRAETCGN